MKKPQFKETRGRPKGTVCYDYPTKKGQIMVTHSQMAVYQDAKRNGYKVRTWKHENVIYVERLS
jgi:hypothetical protein